MSEPTASADLLAAARIAAAADALSEHAVRLAQRYVRGVSPAVDDATAALLHAAQTLYGLPLATDARRALMDDPILHAVYTHGLRDGLERAERATKRLRAVPDVVPLSALPDDLQAFLREGGELVDTPTPPPAPPPMRGMP